MTANSIKMILDMRKTPQTLDRAVQAALSLEAGFKITNRNHKQTIMTAQNRSAHNYSRRTLQERQKFKVIYQV